MRPILDIDTTFFGFPEELPYSGLYYMFYGQLENNRLKNVLGRRNLGNVPKSSNFDRYPSHLLEVESELGPMENFLPSCVKTALLINSKDLTEEEAKIIQKHLPVKPCFDCGSKKHLKRIQGEWYITCSAKYKNIKLGGYNE